MFDANLHLSCVKTSTISEKDRNELSLEPRHVVVPSSASKIISEPMVRLAQTMHLSCADTNTVSKQEEVRFHMTHMVRSSLWYVRRKLCVYLISRLALYPNGYSFHLSLIT
jgi:hypothetical protein